jgi:23S rRNA-/tRNA-specific pseudouridylate synthase
MKKERLDIYLSRLKKDFSRSACQRFICDFGVNVNGKRITSSHFSVSEGDKVLFSEKDWDAFEAGRSGKKSSSSADAPAFSKEMIIADEKGEFFVINKPAGITTEEIVEGFWPVHRLDKDTRAFW